VRALVRLRIPSGGFVDEGNGKFCGGCGRSLSAAPTPAALRFTSPHAYTPEHLAEKILPSKSAVEGERKEVTVLFADLKLFADRDPEDARRLLDPVLEHMVDAVHQVEGTPQGDLVSPVTPPRRSRRP